MRIKSGNRITLVVPVKDSAGAVVTDLATATAVKFMIKNKKTDLDSAALVTKTVGSGVAIDDNAGSPETGTISIIIDAPDTKDIKQGTYFMALQIEY